jgi:hypothetical protein
MRASFRYLILANPVGALKPPAATTNQLSPRYVRLYARRGGSKALGLKVKVRSQVPPRRPRTALLGTSRPPPPRAPARSPLRQAAGCAHSTCPHRHAASAAKQTGQSGRCETSGTKANAGDFAAPAMPPKAELAFAQMTPENHADTRVRTACTLATAPVPGGPRAPPRSPTTAT